MKYNFIYLIVGSIVLSSCGEDPQKYEPTPYTLQTPVTFPDLYIHPDNPLTEEGVALGRMLYYDTMLDGVNTRSCSKCHQQTTSFTSGPSNALAHINIGWNKYFLWNGKIEGSLEDIMYFEVSEFFKTDLQRFNDDENYALLFEQAFGVTEITYKELAYALAQFERTKISATSRYDLYKKGVINFTESELRGFELYYSEKGDCFHCHGTELLTDREFHNNGLDATPADGRMEITNDPLDRGKFKTPTLRNIALTGPYMHDGRFETLEEVVDFYSEGVVYSETIDPLMKNVGQGGVKLSAQEKADLIAFLKTFTDNSYIENPNLSNPF